MKILTPMINIAGNCAHQLLTSPRDYIANPKAVAAQTFASPRASLNFHNSGKWIFLSSFFEKQQEFSPTNHVDIQIYLCNASDDIVVYPYIIAADAVNGACRVWLQNDGKVRHVRTYSAAEHAQLSNEQLTERFYQLPD